MKSVLLAFETFKHPYQPWEKDHQDTDGKIYRGWKANENQREWLLYTLPMYWMFTLYAPAIIDIIPGAKEYSKFVPWLGTALACAYAYFDVEYLKGYMKSSEDRLSGFYPRIMISRIFSYTSVVGMFICAAQQFGLLD